MRTSSLCFLLLLAGCGQVESGPSSSGGPSNTKPTDPVTTEPAKPAKGSKGAGDVSFYSVEGDGMAFAHFVAGPLPPRPTASLGCAISGAGGSGRTSPAEVSAGRVTISGTADGKKFAFPIDWDARDREYRSKDPSSQLPGASLGTLRFEAVGDEVPPFDVLLEPLPPVKIVAPAMDSVLDGGDLGVTWDTVGRGTALVSLNVGGNVSVDCVVSGTERSVTISSALVREALEDRRAAGQPAVCEKTACATLIVGTFTGTSVDVEGWDIGITHAQLTAVSMDIVPK